MKIGYSVILLVSFGMLPKESKTFDLNLKIYLAPSSFKVIKRCSMREDFPIPYSPHTMMFSRLRYLFCLVDFVG